MQKHLLDHDNLSFILAGRNYNLRLENNKDHLADNVQALLEEAEMDPVEIYSGQQNHGQRVEYADGQTGQPFIFGRTFEETDGLVTDKKGIALLVKFADCTPVVIYDPVQEVLGVVHSGWRGTVQRISQVLINKMVNDFACQVDDLLVYVGPSIDQNHYEVGPEVYAAFESFADRDDFFQEKGQKYQLSMVDANLSILREAGLRTDQIQVDQRSTWTSDDLHSSRQEGKDYQLNGILVMMNED